MPFPKQREPGLEARNLQADVPPIGGFFSSELPMLRLFNGGPGGGAVRLAGFL